VFLRIRSFKASVLALLAGVCIVSSSHPVYADVSTWLGIAAGASQIHSLAFDQRFVPTLRLGTGMGTDPSHAWVVGGLFRVDTLFGSGTDLSLLMRIASHGYVNGEWGIAADLGPTARFWGPDSYGGAAVVTIGAPWGLEAGLNANFGKEPVRSYGCFFGVDLARLTVYRRSGSTWWKNSFPAYRTPEEQAH
jgi:hypothetical protein